MGSRLQTASFGVAVRIEGTTSQAPYICDALASWKSEHVDDRPRYFPDSFSKSMLGSMSEQFFPFHATGDDVEPFVEVQAGPAMSPWNK